jgi:hypothetical protein
VPHLARFALSSVLVAASPWAGAYSFVSAPHLHPPRLQVLARRAGLARGDFLVANVAITVSPGARPVGQAGPMILDSRARPIWFRAVSKHAGEILDFEQETYLGKPVLLWVQGHKLVVVNQHYRTVATLRGRAPWSIDGHDAQIVGGDVWVTVARPVGDQNLTVYGGPRRGVVDDSGVQEYDLATGQLIRTWDALKNIPLAASEQPWIHGPWDAYHLNAVQPLPDGDLLISMRDTSAVYLLDPATSHVVWTLGGRRSTFTFGPGARFAWQHDAKLVQPEQGGEGTQVALTLFNDDCCVMTPAMQPGRPSGPSEGMVLDLNTGTHRAALVAAYRPGPPGHSVFLGSTQLLPGGNALVGWGSDPYFSEFSPSGRRLLNVRWPGTDQSYRTLFTDTWVGTPYYPPWGAVRGRTVYASWNGATLVARWEVLGGGKIVATRRRTGFETAIRLPRSYAGYRVRALSAHGTPLGTSPAFS